MSTYDRSTRQVRNRQPGLRDYRVNQHGHTAPWDGGVLGSGAASGSGGGGGSASGMANPMTTQDDVIVGGASGVPTRLAKGSDGQVLTVDPSTHHLLWATPAASASPLTTKGDLYGRDTADARVPIGTDGYVLTADSTQALGLKWAASASGFADPTTTKGDLIVHGASTTRLGVGSDGQVLTADSTQTLGVKWAAAGGTTDPITAAFGTAATAYEFDTSSLTGLTQFGAPDTIDAGTTVPGSLYIKQTKSSWQFFGVYVNGLSTPYTLVTKVSGHALNVNYGYVGCFVGESTPGKMALLAMRWYNNASGDRGVGGYLATSPTDSAGGGNYAPSTFNYAQVPFYLAIVAASSTSVSSYGSHDGRVWSKLQSAMNPGATMASAGLMANAGSLGSSQAVAASFDFLRIFSSALTLPGV